MKIDHIPYIPDELEVALSASVVASRLELSPAPQLGEAKPVANLADHAEETDNREVDGSESPSR